ncbi:hypothetical protein [Chakrabartyella piscis]|uniref:hypothetical protein n=1 Tax=Chakrabartyella piscis TaxID=2918914 RepID=UPI0029584E08|nr:hypothetical protein [Chakrabartyella piscis]
MNPLIEKFKDVKLEPNARTMEEVVQYMEENLGAYRVKILESEYFAHQKNAMEFAKTIGTTMPEGGDDIRRYSLPNGLCVVLGMETEYMTAEHGMKYYHQLCQVKGLTQEDIDTKNDRWLQYVLLMDMNRDWEIQDAAFKLFQEEELARRTAEVDAATE